MRVNVDVALDAFLAHVGPGVPAHPLPLAFGTLVLAEAPLLPLVGGQAFAFGSGLNTNIRQTMRVWCQTRARVVSYSS